MIVSVGKPNSTHNIPPLHFNKNIMKTLPSLFLALALSLAAHSSSFAQGRTVARLFWQDDSGSTVCYGDLKKSAAGWSLQAESVTGFPTLDEAEQSLVQMQGDSGLVLVGVHDHADGAIGSGWVAIDSGAVEDSHGDHSHWQFKQPPSILHTHVTEDQGNPAHVYKYGKSFVMANDKKNGFTITSAAALRSTKTASDAATFYEGGNGHITLAVVDDRVAYATWIARDGDGCGRVDVVGLGDNGGEQYSIKCPSGGLHDATTNSGKVFFAPTDGICWVDADRELNKAPENVQVHHLSLGKDSDDNPLRTGAFNNLGQFVLFTSGKGDGAKLCWADASVDSPTVSSLPIELSEGDSLATPVTHRTRTGMRLAMMFRENKESPETDSLLIVELDPNNDGKLDDAKLAKSISIGRNQMEGHGGRHEAAVLPGGREVAVTNPADGTISIISLSDLTVTATLTVEGTPTRLIAIGG